MVYDGTRLREGLSCIQQAPAKKPIPGGKRISSSREIVQQWFEYLDTALVETAAYGKKLV